MYTALDMFFGTVVGIRVAGSVETQSDRLIHSVKGVCKEWRCGFAEAFKSNHARKTCGSVKWP